MSASKAKRQVIVAGLEPFLDGEGFDAWPPHITLVPAFHGAKQRRLAVDLAYAAERNWDFEVRLTDATGTALDGGSNLEKLHLDLIRAVYLAGGDIQTPSEIGPYYRPHIEMARPMTLEPVHKIGQFALVEATTDEIFRVNQVYELG